METPWHVLYYQTEMGVCEMRDFIDSRNPKERRKIATWISLLKEMGPQLPRPYADFLRDGIHELRVKLSGNQCRFLYFFCFGNLVVLTHAFTKTTDRVPLNHIEMALKIKADVTDRFKKGEDLYDSFSRSPNRNA